MLQCVHLFCTDPSVAPAIALAIVYILFTCFAAFQFIRHRQSQKDIFGSILLFTVIRSIAFILRAAWANDLTDTSLAKTAGIVGSVGGIAIISAVLAYLRQVSTSIAYFNQIDGGSLSPASPSNDTAINGNVNGGGRGGKKRGKIGTMIAYIMHPFVVRHDNQLHTTLLISVWRTRIARIALLVALALGVIGGEDSTSDVDKYHTFITISLSISLSVLVLCIIHSMYLSSKLTPVSLTALPWEDANELQLDNIWIMRLKTIMIMVVPAISLLLIGRSVFAIFMYNNSDSDDAIYGVYGAHLCSLTVVMSTSASMRCH